jgi:hypothetical protein
LTFDWNEESEDPGVPGSDSVLKNLDFPLNRYTVPSARTVAIRSSNNGFRSIDGEVVEGSGILQMIG